MRKRIVRGRLSHGMADRTLRHMTGEPIITPTVAKRYIDIIAKLVVESIRTGVPL
jgi:hypothetical protein